MFLMILTVGFDGFDVLTAGFDDFENFYNRLDFLSRLMNCVINRKGS